MKKEDIQSRNEAIGLFFGEKQPITDNLDNPIEGEYIFKFPPLKKGGQDRYCPVEFLKYNQKWDSLMPVVDKIKSIDENPNEGASGRYTVVISTNASAITDHDNEREDGLANWFNIVNEDMLEAAWLTISDFCIDYNKNK